MHGSAAAACAPLAGAPGTRAGAELAPPLLLAASLRLAPHACPLQRWTDATAGAAAATGSAVLEPASAGVARMHVRQLQLPAAWPSCNRCRTHTTASARRSCPCGRGRRRAWRRGHCRPCGRGCWSGRHGGWSLHPVCRAHQHQSGACFRGGAGEGACVCGLPKPAGGLRSRAASLCSPPNLPPLPRSRRCPGLLQAGSAQEGGAPPIIPPPRWDASSCCCRRRWPERCADGGRASPPPH